MAERQLHQTKISARFSVKKAHAAQLVMSRRIIRQDILPRKVRYVAGVDVAYTEGRSIGAVAVLDYDMLSAVESKTAQIETRFPYIPTLLSFREIPPAVAAVKKLQVHPDVFLVDGQGIMHPYRLGFASHFGFILDKPTIGVAKSPLIGEVGEFNEDNWAPITDKKEVVGVALMTGKKMKPLYISIGHMVSLEKAIAIVKHCIPNHRIPKPIRLAHNIATREKRKIQNTWRTKTYARGII